MPGTHRLPLLLAFLFVLAALSGCGSDEISGEIPPDDAATLKAALEGVRSEIESDSPDCETAVSQADQFVAGVNDLPADPAAELKPELQAAADRLRTLVETQCTSTEPPTTTQDTTTAPPTSTTDTTSSTTDTTTTDTTTTDTSTDEQPPPGNGDGGGPPDDGGGTDGGTGGTGGGGTGDETGD